MKKLVLACALALAVLATSQQQASAWSSFKLGVGATISWERGGDSSFLWGLSRSRDCSCGPCGYDAPFYAPAGGHALGGYEGMHSPQAQLPASQPATAATPSQVKPVYYPAYYGNSGYQPVGYYYPTYSNAYYQGGYYQAPSYWYGN